MVTFPEDPRIAEYLFLQGETYTEAREHGLAVAAYQRVIREFPQYPQAHEAGYAAILGLDALITTADRDEHELWQRLKIDAQIEFALIFPGDPRAPAVQADAADTLFRLGATTEALDLAENLLVEWPQLEVALQRTALAIIGHVRFEMAQFDLAEQAYARLTGLPLEPGERADAQQRWLASVYKQGEQAEDAGQVDQAVSHYLRMAQIDAAAELAIQGHFDAVAVLEGAQRVEQAAHLLAQFRQSYPDHALAAGLDLRLAGMYEQTGDWRSAAAEYVRTFESDAPQEVRRQSLYRAAQINREHGALPAASASFARYVEAFPRPYDLHFEAIHQLDELSVISGDGVQRRHWLERKIRVHREMGGQATPRITQLAAAAQAYFAEEQARRFMAIRLSHPLPRSLEEKQRALRQAVDAYEALADYGVAEFTTASTFAIADLYRGLSQAIMASDRPGGLSALELEQYEILLEEQAFPFEEQAIELHEINLRRAWAGTYDDWVMRSFAELASLMPGRYMKVEQEVGHARAIH